jgi:uncharacterized membrane protein (DUF106 family)
MKPKEWLIIAGIFIGLIGGLIAYLQTQTKDITQLQDKVEEQEKHFRYEDKRIDQQQRELKRLERDDKKYTEPYNIDPM